MTVPIKDQIIDRLARLIARQAGFVIIEPGQRHGRYGGVNTLDRWIVEHQDRLDWTWNTEFLEQAQQFYERWEFLMNMRDGKEDSDAA